MRQIYLAKHQEAENQQRTQEMRPPVVLRVAQLRMVRGSAEDPADLDLPTPGCAAARSWRSATLNVCTRLQVGERQMPQFQLAHSLVAVYLAADGEAHVPYQISNAGESAHATSEKNAHSSILEDGVAPPRGAEVLITDPVKSSQMLNKQ